MIGFWVLGTSLEAVVRFDKNVVARLSYPMSLAWVVRKLALRPPNAQHKWTPLSIAAIGAANRSEERLLHQTTYWAELGTSGTLSSPCGLATIILQHDAERSR